MIHKAKDLSPDQKMAVESLLGRSVAEDEAISIRALASASAPDWLQNSWENAKRLGVDRLSLEEIDAEIAAARKARRNRQQPVGIASPSLQVDNANPLAESSIGGGV